MISEVELAQMKRNVEMGLDVPPGHQPVLALNCQRLIREVEELRAALRDLVVAVQAYRPVHGALGAELELWKAADKARAALGEKP